MMFSLFILSSGHLPVNVDDVFDGKLATLPKRPTGGVVIATLLLVPPNIVGDPILLLSNVFGLPCADPNILPVGGVDTLKPIAVDIGIETACWRPNIPVAAGCFCSDKIFSLNERNRIGE